MKIELLMKVIDHDVTDEEKEEAKLKKILEGQEDIDDIKFTYKPYVFDLNDVGSFGYEDEEHTKVITQYGLFYAKINYTVFYRIYEASLGKTIKTQQDYKMVKHE